MAAAGTGRRRSAPAETAEERSATKRVVLKRERVLVLPEGVRVEELVAAKDEKSVMHLLGKRVGSDPYVEAWTVVGEFEGDKRGAIEAYAGVPNTPDAKPGIYKAPSVSAMRGGREYEKPPEPKVEAKDID